MKTATIYAAFGQVLALMVLTPPAHAVNAITYLSPTGVDSGNCTNPADPCRTLGTGSTQTFSDGKIVVLGPGVYGAASLESPVEVVANPWDLGVLVTTATPIGININSSLAGAALHISGLDISGDAGANSNIGVHIIQAAQVHLRDCVIRNLHGTPGTGILIESTVNVKIFIENCTLSGNDVGIRVAPAAGTAAVVYLDNVQIESNATFGIQADGPGAIVFLNNSVVGVNGTGLSAVNGGKIFSYKTNVISGNTVNGAPTSSLPLQ